MTKRKIDTRAVGLDVGLAFIKWLTGAENLHYGLWTGLEPSAGNLRRAQDAYTEKLFELLPQAPARILDIGGGAGETARKLLERGYEVDIVVPSAFLARRCRENAPGATVHETTFEDFGGAGDFDLCLFSESYQYIPLDVGLSKCLTLLAEDGTIIISDCFRTPEYSVENLSAKVGGGHREARFRDVLEQSPVEVVFEEDITQAVAPSVDIEQALFNVFGYAATRIDEELSTAKPKVRWMINRVLRLLLSERRRARLDQRLNQKTRTAENFVRYNRYLMIKLKPA